MELDLTNDIRESVDSSTEAQSEYNKQFQLIRI